MFSEYPCGCITSPYQGRVRICSSHRPEKADGSGGVMYANLRGKTKHYPANGEMVANWAGR